MYYQLHDSTIINGTRLLAQRPRLDKAVKRLNFLIVVHVGNSICIVIQIVYQHIDLH